MDIGGAAPVTYGDAAGSWAACGVQSAGPRQLNQPRFAS